jgi:putative transposase
MKKAMNRIRWKIRDLIAELHHKTALFLCKNFDVILLPTYETQQMSCKATRKIRSKTVRMMLTFSPFKFKTFLKQKAFEMGKIVIDTNEAYTSKTVSWTGEVKWNLGGAKTIRDACGVRMDRDYNGARGILLRALVDSPLLQEAFVSAS